MVIRVLNYVQHCYTNEDGAVIRELIKPNIAAGKPVDLSFKGVSALPSSFVNSAFVKLLDDFTFDQVKRSVRFSDTNTQMNDIIKERMTFEWKRKTSAHA